MEPIFLRQGPLTLSSATTAYVGPNGQAAGPQETLSGTLKDTVINIEGYHGTARLIGITGTSLAVKVYVGGDDGSGNMYWVPVVSGSGGSSDTAADTAIVLADTATTNKTMVSWDCAGFTHVKISRTAGSGTIMFYATPATGATGQAGANAIIAALGLQEDAAHASGDYGIQTLTVRKDIAAATAGTTGDYQPLTTDNSGAVWVHELGRNATAKPTVTVDTAAYANLDCIGGIITIAGFVPQTAGRAIINFIEIVELGAQSPPITITFYKATPSGGTYTDNAALALASGDLANKVGYPVRIVAGDYITHGGYKMAGIVTPELEVECAATSLFMLIQADGAYDAVAATDFKVTIGYKDL